MSPLEPFLADPCHLLACLSTAGFGAPPLICPSLGALVCPQACCCASPSRHFFGLLPFGDSSCTLVSSNSVRLLLL